MGNKKKNYFREMSAFLFELLEKTNVENRININLGNLLFDQFKKFNIRFNSTLKKVRVFSHK